LLGLSVDTCTANCKYVLESNRVDDDNNNDNEYKLKAIATVDKAMREHSN